MHKKLRLAYIFIPFLSVTALSACLNMETECKKPSESYLRSLSSRNGYYVDAVVPMGTQTDQFIIISTADLLYVYKQNYENLYSTELDFLKALYDGKIKDIDANFCGYTKIETDENIMEEYRRHGLNHMVGKYLTKRDHDYFFKGKMNYTIVQIMFFNNYYLYYDDHIPTFCFSSKLHDLSIPETW